jgi:uncharacterized repeat protein (TIGR03803 family)
MLHGIRLNAAEMAFQILHEFGQGPGPQFPYGPLIEGQAGDFYGASRRGGDLNVGTIYRITPQGTPTVLYSFEGITHYEPWNVVQTVNGDLFGLAHADLQFGSGTVLYRFRTNNSSFSPIASYQFDFPFGNPAGWLTSDGGTNLYNVYGYGGEYGLGQAFRITTNGSLSPLFTFNGTNGSNPLGRLLVGKGGSLYGAVEGGGAGYGTIFRFTSGEGLTTLATLGLTNGSAPWSFLGWGNHDQIYGTTSAGGPNGGSGTVFRISTNGLLTTLATFYGTNGARPISGPFQAPNGKLYGFTARGFPNTNTFFEEVGSLYSVTTNGTLTTLVKFNGTNAVNPFADFTLARDGNLYGVTSDEGLHTSLNGNSGIFFRLAQVPEVTATILTNGVAWLQWTTFTNGVYRVEAKDTLTNSNWTPLSSNLTATANRLDFTSSTTGFGQRYYRVVLSP